MKATLFFFLSICSLITHSPQQKENLSYSFDYRIKYECQNPNANTSELVNYYINASQNNYLAQIIEKSNGIHEFYFRDQDKLTCMTNINGDLKNPGIFTIPDSLTLSFNNLKAYTAKNYEVKKGTDTIISGKNYTKFIFQYKDLKKAKRKKIGSEVFIIDTSKKVKPFFSMPIALNIWRLQKNMPDGLIVERHIRNYKGEIMWSEKLIEIAPVHFDLLIKGN